MKNKLNTVKKAEMKEELLDDVFFRDSKEAFQNAINKWLKNPEDYMYMNSLGNIDFFKHHDTRDYIQYPIIDHNSIIKEAESFWNFNLKSVEHDKDVFHLSRKNWQLAATIEIKWNEIKIKDLTEGENIYTWSWRSLLRL